MARSFSSEFKPQIATVPRRPRVCMSPRHYSLSRYLPRLWALPLLARALRKE
jgi:hypothetical protein